MWTNGTSSEIMVGIDWDNTGSSSLASKTYSLGTDIQTGGAADFNADGRMDVYGLESGQIYIYYESLQSGYIRTFSDDACQDQMPDSGVPSSITGAIGNTYNLKNSGQPVPNDTLRGVYLVNLPSGMTITLYDSPDGDPDEGYSVITIKDLSSEPTGSGVCVGSFDSSSSTSQYSLDYHKHTNVSVDKYDVAGKVSQIVVVYPD